MNAPCLRIAVIGQHAFDQSALAALIAQLPGLEVVALDADPPPNVVVCDGPPRTATAALPAGWSRRTLLLTTDVPGLDLPPGVAGVFSKAEGVASLAAAIRQVARGEQYLSPSLVPALLEQLAERPVRATADSAYLTDREREILGLLGEGLSNKAIAARLYLSVRTIEGHLARLYAHLGVHTRTEAALVAIHHGLAPRIK